MLTELGSLDAGLLTALAEIVKEKHGNYMYGLSSLFISNDCIERVIGCSYVKIQSYLLLSFQI